MRRVWIGLAFLSASWLPGLGLYHDPNWIAWSALVVLGTGFLLGFPVYRPARSDSAIAAALLIVPLLLAPWPHRGAVLLLLIGLLLAAAPIPRRWPGQVGAAALTAGSILVVQASAMLAYEVVTARSHELPWRLPEILYAVARLLGIHASLDGTTLGLHSIRRLHLLGATWELLLDPATFAFLVGGVTLLCLDPTRRRLRSTAVLVVSVVLWLPIRSGLLIAVYLHRALRTGYDTPLVLMNQFWSTPVHLLLLAGPVLLALRFISDRTSNPGEQIPVTYPGRSKRVTSVVLVLLGSFLITLGLTWEPSGPRKQERVWVDEHRSTWERTDRPYDPNWYGQESGYNYACIYDYCSRFYDMDRLVTPIGPNTLADCDVLVVKVPTARYSPEEIDCIERFVADGGGLLLIGEHTNVFNTGTYLNDIAARFGFCFRYDCLFDIDTVFDQLYQHPAVPHPIVQHVPPLDFAVSCSIDPGMRHGRAAIRARGLRSLPADYHASNYYPQVTDRAESRYGAFVELWTTHHGTGRVAAFGDSTIFSNFSTFEPGKAELMLGMLEWLNHRQRASDPRSVLVGLGALLISGALFAGAPLVGQVVCVAWHGSARRQPRRPRDQPHPAREHARPPGRATPDPSCHRPDRLRGASVQERLHRRRRQRLRHLRTVDTASGLLHLASRGPGRLHRRCAGIPLSKQRGFIRFSSGTGGLRRGRGQSTHRRFPCQHPIDGQYPAASVRPADRSVRSPGRACWRRPRAGRQESPSKPPARSREVRR